MISLDFLVANVIDEDWQKEIPDILNPLMQAAEHFTLMGHPDTRFRGSIIARGTNELEESRY